MTESLKFHISLASAASAPTEFAFLNGAPPISVGQSIEADQYSVPTAMAVLGETLFVTHNCVIIIKPSAFPLSLWTLRRVFPYAINLS